MEDFGESYINNVQRKEMIRGTEILLEDKFMYVLEIRR
jgi:hypothetical protein